MILKRTASKPSRWFVVGAALWCLITVLATAPVLETLWVLVLWEQTLDIGYGIALLFVWLLILLGDVLILQWLYQHARHSSYWLLATLVAMALGLLVVLV